MKDFQWNGEKIGFFLQKKPHQSVPFQGQTVWAKRIFPRLSTIGKELPKGMGTNIASDIFSFVKNGQNPQKKMRDQL
jgi:hypothetical protein